MPLVVLGGLAAVGGGFDVEGRHLAGLLAWILVFVLLVSPYRRMVRFSTPFTVVASLLLALSAFSAISALWSSSTAGSFTEAQRALAYLGFFTAAFLVCQTGRQRGRFVEGLFLAIALVVVIAVADRCLPGTEVTLDEGARMRFPLGYWNANGLFFGIAVVLFAWMNRAGSNAFFRLSAAALIPAALTALYLTYSRGGLVAGLVTLVSLFFLSPHRLRLSAVVAVGVIAAVPAVAVVQGNPAVADNVGGPGAPAEGRVVLLVLAASMVAAALLIGGLQRLADRHPSFTGRALDVSRNSRFLKTVAASGAIMLALVAVVLGGQIWSQFSSDEVYFPDDPRQQFTRLSGSGRDEFNKVAAEVFLDNPLSGTGAGTYRFEWTQRRDTDLIAQDAHSLYLESFAELGIAGGLLVLALIASMVVFAGRAWQLSPDTERDRLAMLLSILLAFVFALGIDWTWELAATAALLMVVSACSIGALQSSRSGERIPRVSRTPSAGRVGAVLVVAWVSVMALAVSFVADQYMKSSASAAADGRIRDSIDYARKATRLEPWSPAPHLQIGTVAQSTGRYRRSLSEFERAAELEPDNWQPPYLKSIVELKRGNLEAASDELEEAARLNPRSRTVKEQRKVLEAAQILDAAVNEP